MKKENKIQAEQKLALLSDLDGVECDLNHDCYTEEVNKQAVNYIMLKLVSSDYVALPICYLCMEELDKSEKGLDYDWVLLICTKCCSTKWINKRTLKKEYKEQVNFLVKCPECE